MISYYLLVTIVDALTAVNEDDWQIAADIKDGNISQFLLKPIDYLDLPALPVLVRAASIFTAVRASCRWRCSSLYLRQYFVLPPTWRRWAGFVLSLVLTALLQFFMSYTMAMLAFWVLEVSTFIFILFAFEYIAGGHLFPLDILPPALAQVALLHAISLSLFFPVSIYMGRRHGADARVRAC